MPSTADASSMATQPATTSGRHLSVEEYEAELMRGMTARQRTLFQAELLDAKKSDSVGMLLAFLLGGLGVHRFYLKDMVGIAYVVFCWTFIPAIVGLVEIFLMPGRVARYNKRQAFLMAARGTSHTHQAPKWRVLPPSNLPASSCDHRMSRCRVSQSVSSRLRRSADRAEIPSCLSEGLPFYLLAS